MLPSPVSENQILEALRQTPAERWGEILAFVRELQATPAIPASSHWTAAAMLKLPIAQREQILTEQAALAAVDYATDPELTAETPA